VRAELAAHERFIIQQNYKKLDEEDAKIEAADAVLKKLSGESRYGEGVTEESFAAKLGEDKMRLITLETKLQISQNAQKEANARLERLKEPLWELPEDLSCEELLEIEASGIKRAKSFKAAACVFSALTALCAVLILVNPFIAIAACAVMLASSCTFWVLFAANSKKLRESCYDIFECNDSEDFRAALEERQLAETEIHFAERTLEEASERASQIRAQYEALKTAIKNTLSAAKFPTSENILADIESAAEEARTSFEKRRNAAREKTAANEKTAEITEFLESIPEEEKEKALDEIFDEEKMNRARTMGREIANALLATDKTPETVQGVCPHCGCVDLELHDDGSYCCPMCQSFGRLVADHGRAVLCWDETSFPAQGKYGR